MPQPRIPRIDLLPSLLVMMQRVQDAAVHGYRYYVTGTVSVKGWDAFSAKMDGKYDVTISRSSRSKRKKAGEAVSLLYGVPHGDGCTWILLVSDGRGRVHGEQQLREIDTRKERVAIGGYELVHDGKCWTWQMSSEQIRRWRRDIDRIAQRPPGKRVIAIDESGHFDRQIEGLMASLYHLPGFRLVRRQIGGLVHYARGEWDRVRPANGPQIRVRTFLPYVRRLANKRREPREAAAA